MDTVQKWSPRLTILMRPMHLTIVHCSGILVKPTCFQKDRIDHGSRDNFAISNTDAAEAASGVVLDSEGPLIPIKVSVGGGGILDCLLHVLAEVSHLHWLSTLAKRRSHIHSSVSQANCRHCARHTAHHATDNMISGSIGHIASKFCRHHKRSSQNRPKGIYITSRTVGETSSDGF
jgi:hypothetical protein